MKKHKLLTAMTALCMGVSALFPGFRPTIAQASEQCDVRVATFNIAATRNAEIAARLKISPKTVEFHISRVLKVLRVRLKDYLLALLILFLR